MANINLQDIEKYFGQNYVVRKLNLNIHDGEFVVLLWAFGLRQDHDVACHSRARGD